MGVVGDRLDHVGADCEGLGDSLPLDVGSVLRMVFFSDDARVLISLASGLIGGAGGGVLTAGVIAVNGAKAQQRYRTAATIRGILSSYRAVLVHDHDQLYRVSHFPESYASIQGQYELAISVLAELPSLSRRKRKRIREGLVQLVGEIPLEFAEARVHLPDGVLDEDAERSRLAMELLKAIHGDEQSRTKGLLSDLLRTQSKMKEHPAIYDQTLGVFDGLLLLVRP